MSDKSTLFKYQWSISKLTRNGEVYNFSKGSSEIKVAFIDSGIDYTHENLLSNLDFQYSRSFVGEHTNIMDYDGHGTMVAGIICGKGILMGVAPNISLIICKITDNKKFKLRLFLQAFKYAISCNVDVINISLSMFLKTNDTNLLNIINELIEEATNKNILIITSAGNTKINLDVHPELHMLGFNPSVYIVAASNKLGELSTYSNYSDKCLLAPGGEWFFDTNDPTQVIITTYPKHLKNIDPLRKNLGLPQGYTISYGTSISCAHFSGTIALFISYFLELNGEKPSIEIINYYLKKSYKAKDENANCINLQEINTYNLLNLLNESIS